MNPRRKGRYKALKKVDVAALAAELVQIPSFSHLPGQEGEIARRVGEFFKEEGIEVRLQEVSPGRPNVLARIPGGGGPSLMLCGHLDTVPGYDMPDAFSGEIRDGMLHGRGSCDMKGAVAAMMAALADIAREGIRPPGELYFAGLVDEEVGGKGAERLAETWPGADAVIVGEPTDMKLCLGHKGLEWIRIRVQGKKVHSGHSGSGVNAIYMAGRLVVALEEEYGPRLKERFHPLLGYPSLNVGTIKGGDQPSTVPDHCELVLDRRFLPMESREQVYRELRELVKKLAEDIPGFSAVVDDCFLSEQMLPHLPFSMDPEDALPRIVRKAMEYTGIGDGAPGAFPAWSDGGMLHSQTGCACVILGPGSLELAHSAKESVPLSDLDQAVTLYKAIALTYGLEEKKETT